MSLLKIPAYKILEALKWELPPEPGTTPIPKDHVRLYHQTPRENLGSIKHNGIQWSKSKGIEGPRAIYADEKGFYGKPEDRPTVEFHVHKNRWKSPPFVGGGDINPNEIIAVHYPWHKIARSIDKEQSKVKADILAGKHDRLLTSRTWEGHSNEGKAVRFIKHKYSVK